MGAEKRVKDTGEVGNLSPGKMLQSGIPFGPGVLLILRTLMAS